MNRWQAFTAICSHLRAGLLDGPPPRGIGGANWEHVIAGSSEHLVTPALAWCLRDTAGVPPEVREYFAAVLTFNGRRNEQMTDGLARLVAALNAVDIEPVLLKGAARLVDGLYPGPGLRLMSDLDVLIPADRIQTAVVALRGVGFEYDPAIPFEPQHHLPMMRERDTDIGVELHARLTHHPHDAIIPAAWFWENTVLQPWRDLRVRLPDPTRSVVHNIVHDQLHHENHPAGRFSLRQLLELALLRARDERTIDWNEIDRRFCDAGAGEVLATYLEFGRVFVGQPVPRLRHAPRRGAARAFRRGMLGPRTRRLANLTRLPIDYLAARWRDPRGAVRLLDPETWSRGARRVKAALDAGKWR